MSATVIPEPRGLPLLGNIKNIDPEFPLGSFKGLAEEHGEIYRLHFPGRSVVVVSSHALVHETCDEKRFKKSVNSALNEIRKGVHDGLFTAKLGEENWGIAHRILMPAFGPISIQKMFDDMHDIASQLALKWARQGPDVWIPVTDDFTRLTLDTLALCSMGYRFNSYYSTELHPFIDAMGDFLTESGEKTRRLPLPSIFYSSQDTKYETDIETMRATAQGVLEARKASGDSGQDLLAAMMDGVDPKTGKKMTDESIMDNLITFLIAGHETTSGLLSFVFHQLMQHPEVYRKAQKEVDDAVGKEPIKVEHMAKLPYISAILRETLRLNATIPLFTVEAFEDTLLAGQYPVAAGETILNLLAKSHLDPKVYGDDANEFKPERMLDEPFEKRMKEFPDCWKPFGNGMRGCIGRPFAWQESLLVVAMLLQNFNFIPEEDYRLSFKQTLTIKPKDMRMRAVLRDNMTATSLQSRISGKPTLHADDITNKDIGNAEGGFPLTVLYGSNSGTCQSLAQRVATNAHIHGFKTVKIDYLDNALQNLPTGHPILIVIPSYEGQPPDNAAKFVNWLENLSEEDRRTLEKVDYAVFGCGNREWSQTLHRIPKLVDNALKDSGANRIAELGLADAANAQIFTDFESWEENVFWPALQTRYDVSGGAMADSKETSITISTPRVSVLQQKTKQGTVINSEILAKDSSGRPAKQHLEIQLPEGMSYSCGDYLAVLPINPRQSVDRVMTRFRLPPDAYMEVNAGGLTTLPSSIAVFDALSSYVELSQPATKRDLIKISSFATNKEAKAHLTRCAGEDYPEAIRDKRVSIIDILERHPEIELPFGTFMTMLTPLQTRQYSISSSPLWASDRATITYSVLRGPSYSGQGDYAGVASTYLSSLLEGDTLHVAVRSAPAAFKLAENPEDVPLICIAAGTGIAPFRGLLQERAVKLSSGHTLAPCVLFFGCGSPDVDDLYRDQLDKWEEQGVVQVRRAYSRVDQGKYVQDQLIEDADLVTDLWDKGAKIYVCGSRRLADGVQKAFMKIGTGILERQGADSSEAGVQAWFNSLYNARYATDVFE